MSDEETVKFAIRVPQNAKPGQKMKVKAPNGATTTITMPDDVIDGMEMHVSVPKHPPAEPPPEPAPAPAPRAAPSKTSSPKRGEGPPDPANMTDEERTQFAIQQHMRMTEEKQREMERERFYQDEAEHIESINTVTAWLLMPAIIRPPKKSAKHPNGGWLGHWDYVWYVWLGLFFTGLQCFVVTAMIMDVTVQNAVSEFTDDTLLERLGQEARTTIVAGSETLLDQYGMPPRGLKYCKNETEWEEMRTSLIAGGMDGEEAAMMANLYKGIYKDCLNPLREDAATLYQFGEPMFISEFIVAGFMLCFFCVETYEENRELFLQALLVFSAPKAKSGRFFDATLYGPSWTFWSKSALLDIFLGIRFYFVSAVALASGQLICANPGIIDCVLNGIALLFIVELDEKIFALMVTKTHASKLKSEVIEAKNIGMVFETKDGSVKIFTAFAMVFASVAALGMRLYPEDQAEMEFYSWMPGTPQKRINFLTGLLAVIGWVLHVWGVYKVERTAHKQSQLEEDDDSVARVGGKAQTFAIVLMQIRALVAIVCACFFFVNVCKLCAFQEFTSASDVPDGMSTPGSACLWSLVVWLVCFVTLTTIMDAMQPPPKNHCWNCNKKGTRQISEEELEAMLKSGQVKDRAGAMKMQSRNEMGHFTMHEGAEEEKE